MPAGCGSPGGYQAHRKRKEVACVACCAAHSKQAGVNYRRRKGRLNLQECIDALDDINAETAAEAREKAEEILLKFVAPRVAVVYRRMLERAAEE